MPLDKNTDLFVGDDVRTEELPTLPLHQSTKSPSPKSTHSSTGSRTAQYLLVSEVFGLTLQGEGPSTGRPCMFIRLGGCNLQCVWCDTPYTWDASRFDLSKELTKMSFDEVKAALAPIGPSMLVVSGGEPLLQDSALAAFFAYLQQGVPSQQRTRVEIETAGTLIPRQTWPFVDQFNVSPKLNNSGNAYNKRRKWDALEWFANSARAYFKFVCITPADFEEVDQIVGTAGIKPDHVYIMPEGVTQEAIDAHTRDLVKDVIARGYNLTQRLQVTLWGNTRGT